IDGEVAFRDGDVMRLLSDLPAPTRQRIRKLIRVRDAVREVLRTQVDGSDETTVLQAREALNHAYDSFVAGFGPISMRSNIAAFRADPDRPLLLSLDHYDDEDKTAE